MSWIVEEEVVDYKILKVFVAYTLDADDTAFKSANELIDELKKAHPKRIYKLRKYS